MNTKKRENPSKESKTMVSKLFKKRSLRVDANFKTTFGISERHLKAFQKLRRALLNVRFPLNFLSMHFCFDKSLCKKFRKVKFREGEGESVALLRLNH